MSRPPRTELAALAVPRPAAGLQLDECTWGDLSLGGQVAWQSQGGASRGHPARSYPISFECPLEAPGPVVRLHLLGVFARYAEPKVESPGTLGATCQLFSGGQLVFHRELVNGRHYREGTDLTSVEHLLGDGTSVSTIGTCREQGETLRVDALTIDLPDGLEVDQFKFKDLGAVSSFAIFDVFVEMSPAKGCPFRSTGGGIPLADISSIIRVGDPLRFTKSLDLLATALGAADDLDEARGQALTYLAMVTAAMLEMGGDRTLHREQLDAAREFERATTIPEVIGMTRARAERVTASLFKELIGPSSYLVDRALSYVDRNYARELTDSSVAVQLGLSTSHFRFLFKQATGQPFHKYLIALRLEKARQLLVEQELPVGLVAKAVGFGGLSHFSRAFTQRFSVSPTGLRRTVEEP